MGENNPVIYQLVITEKPSVAQAVAKVIGADKRKDGYLEGNGYLVSWCVGHLVGLAPADSYDPRYSRWTKDDLPIIPAPWRFMVSPSTKGQFALLKSLMERPDVECLVNACDAGREGELIFRLSYQQAGCQKPFKRLWISSMEDKAVREGFEHLRPGSDYDTLYDAALCRAKADWLVGINGTRLFTTLYNGRTLNVGRVMTPTLAMLTGREEEIEQFRKEKFYVVELDCGSFCVRSDRYKSRTEAEKIRKACLGKNVMVRSVERRERKEKPPKLYDLTALQRDANRIYGFTAQQTLDYTQSLYEKKLATYPRTDSRYLTDDMAPDLPALCQVVASGIPGASGFSGKVDASLVTDSSRVSDHHAILPTTRVAGGGFADLPTGEKKILIMISMRLLCAVCPEEYVSVDTEVSFLCESAVFNLKGRVELRAGWKEVERPFFVELKVKEDDGDAPVLLPELSEGQTITVLNASLREGGTKAPDRYTEGSLLAMMENAGAEDFARIGDVERKGLGTAATRAGIIEKLIKSGFVERKKKLLLPTLRGVELIKALPEAVKSVGLTAQWEAALKEVEKGELPPENFMDGITQMVCGWVDSYVGVAIDSHTALSGRKSIGSCPRCGKPVYEGKKSFYCSGYKDSPSCGFALWKNNPYFQSKRKELTKEIAAALLEHGRVEMAGLYSERKGVFYDAVVVMEDTGGKYVNFRLEFDGKKNEKEKSEKHG